jgi:hypothetical protein
MLLKEIKEILNCKSFSPAEMLEREITCCSAADLMSDVLQFAKTGSLILTGLTSNQILHVAEILDLSGIILVRGKIPDNELIAEARARNIPLLSTKIYLFDACGILYEHGMRAGKSVKNKNNESQSDIQPIVHN